MLPLDNGVFVDFFGIPACAGTGFAKLAAHTGAAVIPGFALWSEAERKFVLRFYPTVDDDGRRPRRYSAAAGGPRKRRSASIPISGFGSTAAGRRGPREKLRCMNPQVGGNSLHETV